MTIPTAPPNSDYEVWCAVLDRVTRAQAKAVASQDVWTRLLHADVSRILDRIVALNSIVMASGEAAGQITQDRDRLRAENGRLRSELKKLSWGEPAQAALRSLQLSTLQANNFRKVQL